MHSIYTTLPRYLIRQHYDKSMKRQFILFFALKILFSILLLLIWIIQVDRRDFVCFTQDDCLTIWDGAIIKGKYFGFLEPKNAFIMKFGHWYEIGAPSGWHISEEGKVNFEPCVSNNSKCLTVSVSADPIPELYAAFGKETVVSHLRVFGFNPIAAFLLDGISNVYQWLLLMAISIFSVFSINVIAQLKSKCKAVMVETLLVAGSVIGLSVLSVMLVLLLRTVG